MITSNFKSLTSVFPQINLSINTNQIPVKTAVNMIAYPSKYKNTLASPFKKLASVFRSPIEQ